MSLSSRLPRVFGGADCGGTIVGATRLVAMAEECVGWRRGPDVAVAVWQEGEEWSRGEEVYGTSFVLVDIFCLHRVRVEVVKAVLGNRGCLMEGSAESTILAERLVVVCRKDRSRVFCQLCCEV